MELEINGDYLHIREISDLADSSSTRPETLAEIYNVVKWAYVNYKAREKEHEERMSERDSEDFDGEEDYYDEEDYFDEEVGSDLESIIHSVAMHENTPAATLYEIAKDSTYYHAKAEALENPGLGLDNIKKLLPTLNSEWLEYLAKNMGLGPEGITYFLEYLKKFTIFYNSDILINLAKQENASEDNLRYIFNLAENGLTLNKEFIKQKIFRSLAVNRSTPSDLLEKLVDKEDFEEKSLLIGNRKFPPELLFKLNTEEIEDKIKILERYDIPEKLFKSIEDSIPEDVYLNPPDRKSKILVSRVLQNRYVSLETLELSSESENSDVLIYTILSSNITEELLEKIYGKNLNDESLLSVILSSPKVPVYILEKEVAEDRFPNVYRKIANNPKATPEMLDQLAYKKDTELQKAIARNKKVLPKTLDRLAETPYISVLEVVLESENIDKDTLIKFLDHPNVTIREKVYANPILPHELKGEYILEKKRQQGLYVKEFSQKRRIPKIDYESFTTSPAKSKNNSDLELLKRLKGYIKSI